MKTLYESILNSTNSGKNVYIKTLLKNPIGKEKKINNLWKEMGLVLDFGDGPGYWSESSDHERFIYFVPIINMISKIEIISVAIIKDGLASDIVVFKKDKYRRQIKKWVTEICKTIKATAFIDKNYMYIDFE